ncbi:hypothetical protein [Mesorhizobium sp. M1322]|uniref:hypothetical protein n=1 Tax=Mesorhizobium sp. M1322 TaxID=2957081 RepID=UPI00333ADEB9
MKAVNHASPGGEIANWNCKKTIHKLAVTCNTEALKGDYSYAISAASVFFTADKLLILNDNGGPGGRIQTIDFIAFFVGLNRKSSRIVSYGSATAIRLKLVTPMPFSRAEQSFDVVIERLLGLIRR